MCRNRNKDRNPFSSPPAAWSFAAILVLGLAVFSSSTVWGQTVDEAQTAVEEARQSVALDPESVPARLQLAQALYGAGEIDEAIETWRAVVKLSPTETSAAAMVKLLTGYRGSIDEKLELLEKLVDAGLYSDVVSQCMRIINSTAASDQQQAKAALLQAEMAPTTKAGGMVREARIRYGDAVDPVHAEMIEAAAAIDSGNEIERAEAVGRLAALVKDAAGKREAILAEFFLSVSNCRMKSSKVTRNRLPMRPRSSTLGSSRSRNIGLPPPRQTCFSMRISRSQRKRRHRSRGS